MPNKKKPFMEIEWVLKLEKFLGPQKPEWSDETGRKVSRKINALYGNRRKSRSSEKVRELYGNAKKVNHVKELQTKTKNLIRGLYEQQNETGPDC